MAVISSRRNSLNYTQSYSLSNPDLTHATDMNSTSSSNSSSNSSPTKKIEPPRRRSSSIKHALSSFLNSNLSNSSSTINSPQRASTSSSRSGRKSIDTHSTQNSMRQPVKVELEHTKKNRRHSTNSIAHNRLSYTSCLSNPVLEFTEEESYPPDHVPMWKPFNNRKFLVNYLTDRGFMNTKLLMDNKLNQFKISIAATGDTIFLPTLSSNDDEYIARLNGLRGDESEEFLYNDNIEESGDELNNIQEGTDVNSGIDGNSVHPEVISTPPHSNSGERQSTSGTTGTTSMDTDTNSRVPFSIAVVLKTEKVTTFSDIYIQLCSKVKVFWNNGVPPTKSVNEEFYNAGTLDWTLNSKNFNLYIPANVSSNHQVIQNNLNNFDTKLFKNLPLEERNYLDKKKTKDLFFQKIDGTTNNSNIMSPGTYVYILPIIFSNHIPESIYFPSARVNYKFKIGTKLLHDPSSTTTVQSSAQLNTSNPTRNDPGSDSNSSPSSAPSSLSLSSLASSSSLKATEAEKAQSHTKITNTSIFKKVKNSLHISPYQQKTNANSACNIFAEYPIRLVRTPPPISISTANKPIYINRVWTDSLSYEISFAQKYVSLNNDYTFKIKLAPMMKNICVKRIRVSINEKITFVSKNYEYEYDQIDLVAKDPYNPYYLDFTSKRRKERNLSLLEIRTKERGSRAIREEIVENACGDNLLSYNTISDRDSKNKKHDAIGITEEISIETKLHFPRFEDLDKRKAKIIAPYGIDIFTTEVNPETQEEAETGPFGTSDGHRSSVIGYLNNHNPIINSNKNTKKTETTKNKKHGTDSRFNETTIKTCSGMEVKSHTRLNNPKRGLYLDSLHFSNIHARHKLEVMLRISKPDPVDPSKLRHYEVLIDTPIVVVSERCNTGNMELPTYHMAVNNATSSTTQIQAQAQAQANNRGHIDTVLPPSFEEAISVPASPIGSPIASPIGSPNLTPSYDPDICSIQQFNLSRATSISGPPDRFNDTTSNITPPATTGSSSGSVMDSTRYSNLDGLLSTSMEQDQQNLFKNDYSLNKKEAPTAGSNPPDYDDIINQ